MVLAKARELKAESIFFKGPPIRFDGDGTHACF